MNFLSIFASSVSNRIFLSMLMILAKKDRVGDSERQVLDKNEGNMMKITKMEKVKLYYIYMNYIHTGFSRT